VAGVENENVSFRKFCHVAAFSDLNLGKHRKDTDHCYVFSSSLPFAVSFNVSMGNLTKMLSRYQLHGLC
jgi:hypothetical protein